MRFMCGILDNLVSSRNVQATIGRKQWGLKKSPINRHFVPCIPNELFLNYGYIFCTFEFHTYEYIPNIMNIFRTPVSIGHSGGNWSAQLNAIQFIYLFNQVASI